jgi:hypothetical protein
MPKTRLAKQSGRGVLSRRTRAANSVACLWLRVEESPFSATIEFRYNRNLREGTAFLSRP